jgi:polysaccharide biosynthesis transport protein
MEEVRLVRHRGRTILDYLGIVQKRRWTMLSVFAAVVCLVALWTFTATPKYQASVQLLIERQPPRLLENQQTPSDSFDRSGEQFYKTQYKLLESRALAKKVAEKLYLKDRPPYSRMFSQLPPEVDKVTLQRVEERLVDVITNNVEVSPIRESSLVNVSYSSPDPKFAAEVANALAQCFIEQSLALRFAASQEAAGWLRNQLAEARKKLEESETRLNKYRRQHNIVAIEDKESITAQKLEQLNKELVAAQTKRMEAEARFQQINAGQPIADVLNNPLIQQLKAQEAKLITEQSELSKKYGEGHPRMIQLRQEIGAIRGRVNAETGTVTQAIRNEYRMAKAQEEKLQKALEEQKTFTQDQSDAGGEYRVLLRDVETNRALYENVLKSLKTTIATENLPATNIRIVYPALVPEKPVSPRKFFNLLVALGVGLFLGVGLAVALENLDTTLKTPEEVERWLELPNLALISHIDTSALEGEAPELVVHHGHQPQASEAYRVLRTSLLFSSSEPAPRVLLITSTLPGEGKTLSAANLGTAIAKTEVDVLLIDADLRRPSLHELFKVPREPGLGNFLDRETDELPVVATLAPHLFLMPAGKTLPNPSELLGAERMRELLGRIPERFSQVILDSPPLMSITDAAILSTQVDGVILVVKAETVPRKAVRDVKDHLLELQAPLLGVVLNDVPLQGGSYYYSHYRYYSSYYADDKTTGSGDKKPDRLAGVKGWLGRFKG